MPESLPVLQTHALPTGTSHTCLAPILSLSSCLMSGSDGGGGVGVDGGMGRRRPGTECADSNTPYRICDDARPRQGGVRKHCCFFVLFAITKVSDMNQAMLLSHCCI